jgi:hypothetical protein
VCCQRRGARQCKCVGDFIIYEHKFHKVTSFGLLWTQLHRDDGVRVSVRYSLLLSQSFSTSHDAAQQI